MDPASFPVILTYHSISEGASPTRISPRLFAAQIEWLHDHVQVAPLEHVVDALVEGEALPERTVVLTFDDGYRDFYFSAAPLLRHFDLPATLFLTTAWCGGAELPPGHDQWQPHGPLLNWQQAADLAREGFQFGSHSITHPGLTELQHEQANHEIRGSRAEMEERLGQKVEYFAYPYGRWNHAVRDLVRLHYRAACSTGAGVVQPDCDPLALPRVDAHYLRTPAALRSLFTARFLAYVATRRFIRRMRRQPEGIYARV